ncbi:MAG TPA: circularly permuted type 2 ATP-grasp protein, partial [Pirellulales bacterium]|nr:circularly permuted type 2 ATP-grasp protein [Pirellulales bacterium]
MNRTDQSRATDRAESLLEGYRPPNGVYDEMIAPDGNLREAWVEFSGLIDALGRQELSRRWEQARRILHEDGVTYNVHGDQGRERRWELDALPLVVSAEQWATLSSGLAQRARLLDAILRDLYGAQRLLLAGLLPAELVFANPRFLRPCHGWRVAADRHLHLYAAHLARSSEGTWSVVADRTQAPVGAGYAVENRIVISRMMPHVFQHCRVQRLAGFFIALRETLRASAPGRRENPHTVLLSPGPTSPTYFEDAYLARYLGYTLVEGEDLTVRDNRVYLKTLGGLLDVEVILRRVADRDSDPLELSSESRLGVAGLMHAARRGNVVLANAVGSGLAETPALMAFLPALCRELLSEDLLLPSVPTWWCGQADSLRYVLDHLDRLVIRPAVSDTAALGTFGGSLDHDQQHQLRRRIENQPHKFVAQEFIVRSTAPVWSDECLTSGHIGLRMFAAAAGDSFQVMPGALAHVSASSEVLGESMWAAHGSKDFWVKTDGPVSPLTLLQPPGTPIAPRRSGHDLPSRVADNLFWLGRHVERAEGAARLLRSIFMRLTSESAPGGLSELGVLHRALSWQRQPGEVNEAPYGLQTVSESQFLAFIYDREDRRSLRSLLGELRRVASVVRDRISLDSWRIVGRLEDDFHPGYPLGVVAVADVVGMLNQMILDLSAFSGVAMENMTRGPGWQFLDLGRRIERAFSTISLLRSTLFVPADNEHSLFDAL